MDRDRDMYQVLQAIYKATKFSPDIVVEDAVWLEQLPAGQRQAAVETYESQLASFGFIRRGAGHAAVTALGVSYFYQHPKTARSAA